MKDDVQKKITIYLAERDLFVEEGSSSKEERDYLCGLVSRFKVKRVGEIGFNAGFSAYALLQRDPTLTMVSFDTADHAYVKVSKELVDQTFPGRHQLVIGDSTVTVPQFAKENPEQKFDLIFIDGAHDFESALADLQNMKLLAGDSTVIVMDDLLPWKRWGEGPTKAWGEAIRTGLITQFELFQDGVQTEKAVPPGDRVWALGRYNR